MSKSQTQMADDTTVTLSNGSGTYSLGGSTTITNGGYAYSNTAITNNGVVTGTTYPGPYTITSGTGVSQPWFSNTVSPKIRLDGEGADIEINGVSLMEILQERLNVMIPNPELEKEWNELKELGDQYRALEAKLKEQGEMWAKLKSMPPPDPLY